MSVSSVGADTRVLAIASHVVSGYVGNKIAVFVLQALGCDVAALNTVQFSNHTGYRQFTGTKVSAQEIQDLYNGLRQSYLDDFDMMLTGYIPGAEAVTAVGAIAAELKAKFSGQPGRFFWVLDPVMGDNGKIYVSEEVVPAYKALVPLADLVLPNQFEAELLSDIQIVDIASLAEAIRAIHEKYRIPHIVITSVKLVAPDSHLSVVGSSMTSTGTPRIFKIVFPSIDCFFSGTGDMFAAMMVIRMREAAQQVPGLRETPSWLSGDETASLDLPLARAVEKVLASMHEVLSRTAAGMTSIIDRTVAGMSEEDKGNEKKMHLVKSKAAEVNIVRHLDCLRSPGRVFSAETL